MNTHRSRRYGLRRYDVERTDVRRQTVRAHRAKSNQVLKNLRAHGFDGDAELPRFLGTQGFVSY